MEARVSRGFCAGSFAHSSSRRLTLLRKMYRHIVEKENDFVVYYRVLSNDVESTFKNERKCIILLNLQRKNR